MDFERIASEEIWQGHVGGVRVDTFRYADGGEAKREVFTHPGAVTILPFDGERIWLVRQPREPVGEPDLLELPAGKIDKPGEELDALALRELQEEIGKGARSVRHLVTFYNSPGILTEEHHLFLATDLFDSELDSGEDERIEIETLHVTDLDAAIPRIKDAKTLIGLLWFRAYMA
jgi:ADP-ribose pyrophosphatase